MNTILRRILKTLAYAAAAVVVLLAVLVGLFRLFLPRLPEYQDEIKAWASDAIGMQVEFAGMDARWGLHGPELSFYDAELIRPTSGTRVIAASEVGVGVSLLRLLVDRTFVVDTVRVRDSGVEFRENPDGTWSFQGQRLDELMPGEGNLGSIDVLADDIDVHVLRDGDERPTDFTVRRLVVQRDAQRTAIDADLRLPDALGTTLTASATRLAPDGGDARPWNVMLTANDLPLDGWSALIRDPERRVTAGTGDVDVSFAIYGRDVRSVSATVDLAGVSLNDAEVFDMAGKFAFSKDANGWLAAADEFRVTTARGAWPLTSIRVEAGTESGRIALLDVRASYLDFADLPSILPWLGDAGAELHERLKPDGRLRNLVATVSDPGDALTDYAITAELERVGIEENGSYPGVRGFSGTLRADPNGGLLDVDATNVMVTMTKHVPEPIEFDRVDGTVIWRKSGDRVTILSDAIELRNAVFQSRSNIEIGIAADQSPVVDLASNWSIGDVATAKRFIPRGLMSPKLYDWFQAALQSGRLVDGTARLNGSLDRFPFDDGSGELRIEARAENLDFRYLPTFPTARVREMSVVLRNTHLFSHENRSTSSGTSAVNAKVDIRDLRQPVLTIEALSTGTLAQIRQFAADSPIAAVFGGQLDRVTVQGEGSVALDLTVPLTDARNFDVTARVQTGNGTVALAGLGAPITELSGAVVIGRRSIRSEALGGRFLGHPLRIELSDAGPELPAYRVLLDAEGTASAESLIGELGVPLPNRLSGNTPFQARVRFPRRDESVDAAPLDVHVVSDLVGLGLDLPAPFTKPAADPVDFAGDLVFPAGGERIESNGHLGEDVSWGLAFARLDGTWDFDRGMLMLGGAPATPPDVRGLHVHGTTPELRADEWLRVSSHEGAPRGAGSRIRSIDLLVGDLYFIGQRLSAHQLKVDRSARDWLVQLEGDLVSGSIFVPYDFSPASTLVLDMDSLVLPGDGSDESGDGAGPGTLDPREVPALSLRTREFGLGGRRFGAVEAEFRHDGEGLVSDDIVATDPTFGIRANARWQADPSDPLGSRTALSAVLTSSDVAATMTRLGYDPGIVSDEMRIDLDMRWSGGPHGRFLESMDGTVAVTLGAGQLNEVEPGAGRVFGLMSLGALPRRLSLDFRDVFQKGFGFDAISGTFRLDDGTAYTCDLSLVGPAADIGIIGQVDLVEGTYAQAAVVSANLGNTLPVVGAIAAGPQVAAAMFVFSQIFKKPLKEVGQVYYSMTGPWDSPVVDAADAGAFASSAELAGCLDETG